MSINYNDRRFRSVSNSKSGEVSAETVFQYRQNGSVVTADYSGGKIVQGNLIAVVDENGSLDMRYQHINSDNEIMTGKCASTAEILPDGRIRLHEKWQWTSGPGDSGESVIEEI